MTIPVSQFNLFYVEDFYCGARLHRWGPYQTFGEAYDALAKRAVAPLTEDPHSTYIDYHSTKIDHGKYHTTTYRLTKELFTYDPNQPLARGFYTFTKPKPASLY